jgi:serine-type D-Ala-D-Ala carboxypeptidase (penicillin-binding protein 5/6)
MKRLLVSIVALCAAAPALAQMPQPPEIAAKAYVLLDLTTGQTLAEREADTPADPASLTKLMTAYVVFGALRDRKISLEQTLPVSLRAWEERKGGGSLMFIEPRMTPKVSDLLRGMIVNSGNDASVVLAEGVGGTLPNFIALMNRQAQLLGLKNTSFKNATGLTEPGHKSSARDLSVIAGRIITDFPEYYPLYSIRKYHFEGAPTSNENNRNVLLLRDPSVDGMKTGYTEALSATSPTWAALQAPAASAACSAWCSMRPRWKAVPLRAKSCSTGAIRPSTPCASSRPAKP